MHRWGVFVAVSVIVWGIPVAGFPWGREGHTLITRKAIAALPPAIRSIFETHADELVRLANVPDTEWRARKEYEARGAWHYLHLDRFDFPYPFNAFPRDRNQAERLYQMRGPAGYLPWVIADFYRRLVQAFRQRDVDVLVENAGLLAHFAGDATVPLHTTRNGDGRFSGNAIYRISQDVPTWIHRDVHLRFEMGLIRHRLKVYDQSVQVTPQELTSVDDVVEAAFKVIVDAHWYVDHVIYCDKVLFREMGITKDMKTFLQQQRAYYDRLDACLGNIAVRQLRAAVVFLAQLWYSAWRVSDAK